MHAFNLSVDIPLHEIEIGLTDFEIDEVTTYTSHQRITSLYSRINIEKCENLRQVKNLNVGGHAPTNHANHRFELIHVVYVFIFL